MRRVILLCLAFGLSNFGLSSFGPTSFGPSSFCLAAKDSVMSDFQQFEEKEYDLQNHSYVDRALYSKHTDKWIRAYLDGDSKTAQTEWIALLKAAKGAVSIKELLKGIKSRLVFMEGPDGDKFVKRGNFFGVLKQTFAESETFLGARGSVLMSIAQLAEWEYGDQQDWPNQLIWCQKTVAIARATWPRGDENIVYPLMELADAQFRCAKYAEAKTSAQEVYALAAKYSRLGEQAKARELLVKIARRQKAGKTSRLLRNDLSFTESCFVSPCQAREQDGDNFTLMDTAMNESGDPRNNAWNDRGAYSGSADRWIRAYIDGDNKKAQLEWNGVMKASRGAYNLRELIRSLRRRLEFLEGKDYEKYVARGRFLGAIKQMYAQTEVALGSKNIALASVAQNIEFEYESNRDWPNRAVWCRKSIAIFESAGKINDPRAVFPLNELACTLFLIRDYDGAKKYATKAYEVGAKYSDLTEMARARTTLANIRKLPGQKKSCSSLFSVFSLFFFAPCFAQQSDNAFASLEQGLVRPEEVHDQACCDRGIYSKSYDRWTKAFVDGRDADAIKEWAGVLQAAKGAVSMVRLASCACARLQFLDGKDADNLEKRGGVLAAIKAMYESTAKIMGGETEQALSIAHYLSDKYRNSSMYALSVQYERKYFAFKEKKYGANGPLLFPHLIDLADKELEARDFVPAQEHLNRALALATKSHSVPAQYRARTMLNKLRTLQRKGK